MNWNLLTDVADAAALLLLALGLGALAAGLILGPVIIGVGTWLAVTGLAVGAGSALVQWHNDPKRRDRPGAGGG